MRYFLILLVLFSSCKTSWYLEKAKYRCPECFETTIQKTDTTIVVDTIIEVNFNDLLEIDTTPVIRYDTVLIDNIKRVYPTFDTIIKSEKGLTAKIWMKKGRLNANFELDSSIFIPYKDSINVLNHIIKETTIISENKHDLRQYFIYGIVLLALVLLIVIFKK